MRLFFKILLFIVHCVGAWGISLGSAQVNMEKERSSTGDSASKEGLHLMLDGGLQVVKGNTDLTLLTLNQHIQYIKGIHEPFILVNLSYGEKEETAFVDQIFVHARWTAMWWKTWGTEVFYQVQEDAFRSLIIRHLNGLGMRSLFYSKDQLEGALGLGYMYELETYRQNQINIHERNHRMTSYLTWTYRLKSKDTASPLPLGITLYNTTYFQFKVDEFTDFRILNDLNLEIKLNSWLALIESINLFYDHSPPKGVSPYNLNSMSKLRISW